MTPANDNNQRPASFDGLLLSHEPYIRSRLYAMEKDTTKHDDLFQEVMTKALEQWAKYRTDGNFAGWLYWVVWSTVRRRDRSASHGPDLRATEPSQEYATDISLALERCTEDLVLAACGHSEAEIAQRAGVTPAAAHYRLKAARAALVAANDNSKKAA